MVTLADDILIPESIFSTDEDSIVTSSSIRTAFSIAKLTSDLGVWLAMWFKSLALFFPFKTLTVKKAKDTGSAKPRNAAIIGFNAEPFVL